MKTGEQGEKRRARYITHAVCVRGLRTVRGENQKVVARFEFAHFEFGIGNHKRFQCAIAKGARHGEHTLHAPAAADGEMKRYSSKRKIMRVCVSEVVKDTNTCQTQIKAN